MPKCKFGYMKENLEYKVMNMYDQGSFIVIAEIKALIDGIKSNHSFVYNKKYINNEKVHVVIDN